MSFRLQDVARNLVYPSYSIYRDIRRKQTARSYKARGVASAAAGNAAIRTALDAGRAAALGKIGSLELEAIRGYLRGMNREGRYKTLLSKLHRIAGIFPPTNWGVDEFCKTYLDDLGAIDILAVWYNAGEPEIVGRFCKEAQLVELTALEPYFHSDPWSHALAGKRVLILHPFTKSIERQLHRRSEIWPDGRTVLPEFDATFIEAPLSDALVKSPHASWNVALESLKAEMERKAFDAAIIGAGAFSVPLCAHAKRLGKIGLHLGGATQILFGIRGGRWDGLPEFQRFFSEAWIRPSSTETPLNAHAVERGCYW
jgi:hypothetical protein